MWSLFKKSVSKKKSYLKEIKIKMPWKIFLMLSIFRFPTYAKIPKVFCTIHATLSVKTPSEMFHIVGSLLVPIYVATYAAWILFESIYFSKLCVKRPFDDLPLPSYRLDRTGASGGGAGLGQIGGFTNPPKWGCPKSNLTL